MTQERKQAATAAPRCWVVLVDGDRVAAPRSVVQACARLAAHERLLAGGVVASRRTARVWSELLAATETGLRLVRAPDRQGAVGIALGRLAGVFGAVAGAAEAGWAVVGTGRPLAALVAILRDEALDAEAVGPADLEALARRAVRPEPAALRALAVRLARRGGRVPVAVWAQAAIRAWPELESRRMRQARFGARRFEAVARACGLEVRGGEIRAPA